MKGLSDERLPSVPIGRTQLHYMEVGEGPLVVLVHGGFADYRLWGSLSSVLSQNFRVIAYSRRGAYPNDPVRQGSTIALHSGDLSTLISRFSDTPVHLVGESLGAYVALHCALHRPKQIRSLAIEEPPVLQLLSGRADEEAEKEQFQRKAIDSPIELYSAGKHEDAARAIIDYLEGSAGVYDTLSSEAKGTILANSRATLEDLKKGLGGIEPSELRKLRTSTLLLKSTQGPNPLKRVVDRLHNLIPNSRVLAIEGSSHGTIVDSPGYSAAVLEFLLRN